MSYAPPPSLRQVFEQALRFRQGGYPAEADRLRQQLLQLPAASGEDFYFRGNTLMELGRVAEAAPCFDQALGLGPVTPELLVDRAVALAALGRLEEAAASAARAVLLRPDFAHALFIHGDCLREMGHAPEALASFDRALALQPDFAAVLANRGAVLVMMGEYEAALADFTRLTELDPGDAENWTSRGRALGELNRQDEALASLDKALARDPINIRALHARGVVLWQMGRLDEALAAYDRVLAINPSLAITHSNRANTLQELVRLDEAAAAHDRAVALQPQSPAMRWNRALGLMLRGQWQEGLREFEWRRKRPEAANDYLAAAQPEWTGAEDLSGKTLLIRAEQGLGDTLQFSRYAVLARQKGARVVLAVQPELVRLLQDGLTPPIADVVAADGPLPAFDYHIPAMSLALAFGTEPGNVPAGAPYLAAPQALAAEWASRIGKGDGLRVGVCWEGNLKTDPARSFPLSALAPLTQVPGVRLISIQKGGDAQLAQGLPDGLAIQSLGTTFQEGDFADTAAVLENLDLVITCDTAMAHLAGAMGRPAFIALKRVPEWRWQLEGENMPWYPGLRLFRQSQPGRWDEVFAAMKAALAEKLR